MWTLIITIVIASTGDVVIHEVEGFTKSSYCRTAAQEYIASNQDWVEKYNKMSVSISPVIQIKTNCVRISRSFD